MEKGKLFPVGRDAKVSQVQRLAGLDFELFVEGIQSPSRILDGQPVGCTRDQRRNGDPALGVGAEVVEPLNRGLVGAPCGSPPW